MSTSQKKFNKPQRPFNYTHAYELKDRWLYLDTDYLTNEEGRLKIIEICMCVLGIFLAAGVRGVSGERGLAMLVCALAIWLTVAIWFAKVLTLHRQLHPANWFAIELLAYIFIIGGMLAAFGFLLVFATAYWTLHNPEWQTMPLIATIVLLATAVIYALDIGVLFRNRRGRKYIPDVSTYQMST